MTTLTEIPYLYKSGFSRYKTWGQSCKVVVSRSWFNPG